jgi:hypothetical protein
MEQVRDEVALAAGAFVRALDHLINGSTGRNTNNWSLLRDSKGRPYDPCGLHRECRKSSGTLPCLLARRLRLRTINRHWTGTPMLDSFSRLFQHWIVADQRMRMTPLLVQG